MAPAGGGDPGSFAQVLGSRTMISEPTRPWRASARTNFLDRNWASSTSGVRADQRLCLAASAADVASRRVSSRGPVWAGHDGVLPTFRRVISPGWEWKHREPTVEQASWVRPGQVLPQRIRGRRYHVHSTSPMVAGVAATFVAGVAVGLSSSCNVFLVPPSIGGCSSRSLGKPRWHGPRVVVAVRFRRLEAVRPPGPLAGISCRPGRPCGP